MITLEDEQFKEGQKLEAVDPLEMSRICPATVGKVILKIDCECLQGSLLLSPSGSYRY